MQEYELKYGCKMFLDSFDPSHKVLDITSLIKDCGFSHDSVEKLKHSIEKRLIGKPVDDKEIIYEINVMLETFFHSMYEQCDIEMRNILVIGRTHDFARSMYDALFRIEKGDVPSVFIDNIKKAKRSIKYPNGKVFLTGHRDKEILIELSNVKIDIVIIDDSIMNLPIESSLYEVLNEQDTKMKVYSFTGYLEALSDYYGYSISTLLDKSDLCPTKTHKRGILYAILNERSS